MAGRARPSPYASAREWRSFYTGRLMRAHERKTSVCVYDYADVRAPVLRAMHARRLATYKRLGFTQKRSAASPGQLAVPHSLLVETSVLLAAADTAG